MYVTETTRHANVILPPVSTLERSDIDIVMPVVSVRNHIRFNPAALPKPAGGRTDWEILVDLSQYFDAPLDYAMLEQIWEDIRRSVPKYAGISYSDVGATGVIPATLQPA